MNRNDTASADGDLIRRLQQADLDALGELFERYDQALATGGPRCVGRVV